MTNDHTRTGLNGRSCSGRCGNGGVPPFLCDRVWRVLQGGEGPGGGRATARHWLLVGFEYSYSDAGRTQGTVLPCDVGRLRGSPDAQLERNAASCRAYGPLCGNIPPRREVPPVRGFRTYGRTTSSLAPPSPGAHDGTASTTTSRRPPPPLAPRPPRRRVHPSVSSVLYSR